MPRDAGGTYSLPPGNPVVPGTIIESTWANPTMNDIASALTDSLSRSGKGGMTFSLRGPDGSAAVPTFSFTNEPSSGRYRDGNGTIVESVLGNPIVRYTVGGLEQWNGSAWEPLTPRDALNTPFDPATTGLTATNVQNAIEQVYALAGGSVITAATVTYDDSAVYFPAATVQQAIDRLGQDLAAAANDILDNAAAIDVIEGEIDIIDGVLIDYNNRILQNTNDIAVIDDDFSNFYTLEFVPLRNRVTAVENKNVTQDGRLDTLEFDVDQVEQLAGQNQSDISDNNNDIAELQSRYQNGILQVPYGGTGVTTSTGTGRTVRSDNAELLNVSLTGSPIATTPQYGTVWDNRIVTREYIEQMLLSLFTLGWVSLGTGRWHASQKNNVTGRIENWGRWKNPSSVVTFAFLTPFTAPDSISVQIGRSSNSNSSGGTSADHAVRRDSVTVTQFAASCTTDSDDAWWYATGF